MLLGSDMTLLQFQCDMVDVLPSIVRFSYSFVAVTVLAFILGRVLQSR